MIKRTFDLIGALLGLVLAAPVFLLIALAIKLDSPGPIFYTQTRVGRRGSLFGLHKFRSMVVGADRSGLLLTSRADARVTRLGRMLRLLRLDELPQLFNVVKGDMSLVGPRPEVPSIVENYTPEQRRVLDVRPGITGPTQLAWLDESERYPAGVDQYDYYTRHFLPKKLRSDLEYVRGRSIIGDLGCLFRVPVALFELIRPRVWSQAVLRKVTKLWVDCLAVGLAHLLAFAVRFDWQVPSDELVHVVYGLPLTCLAYALAFVILRTYRTAWEYASIEEMRKIATASALGGSLHALAVFLIGWRPYPRSVVMSTALLTILLIGAIRAFARSGWRRRRTQLSGTSRRRVLIVGAGRTGETIAREICGGTTLEYELVGFLDDNPNKLGETIRNRPVLGRIGTLSSQIRRHQVAEVIIATPSLSTRARREIAEACVQSSVDLRSLPSITELVRGDGKLRYLRKLHDADLLHREPLAIDESMIRAFLSGQRVLVTGAGGSIGSELCRQVLKLGAGSLIMVERAESPLHDISLEVRERHPETPITATLADIKHVQRMTDIFHRFRPQIVFHAAAYKHVPILESHPAEAVLNNVVGTVRLTQVAREFGLQTFVFISTDKAVKPKSLMGATKKICEMYIAALNSQRRETTELTGPTRFLMVRFGNVLGSAGSVIPRFLRQIENGDPVTITDPEMSRFFMTVPEAVGLVMQSAAMKNSEDAFILDMGAPLKIGELVDDLAVSLGLSPTEVARKYVGLRPGEKEHEVLWDGEEEEVFVSEHGRVFAIRQRPRSLTEMELLVRQLETLAIHSDVPNLLAMIRDVVPSFTPGQSQVELSPSESDVKLRALVDDAKVEGVDGSAEVRAPRTHLTKLPLGANGGDNNGH